MSCSELQAGAVTPSQRLPEAPNLLIINRRPSRAGPHTALAKLAVGVLQWRFAALSRTSTRRLNTIYIVVGLISRKNIFFRQQIINQPSLTMCHEKQPIINGSAATCTKRKLNETEL